MDSFTHIALGAVAGELLLGKKLGKRAMVYGAIANSLPDLDFIPALWLNPADNVLVHRGFTHSFSCIILLTFLLAWVAVRYEKKSDVSAVMWMKFIGIQLALHLFVDAFNAYGVGWFIPFSDIRISFNTIYVADPFYSVILIIGALLLLFKKTKDLKRVTVAKWSLIISTAYLLVAIGNKMLIEQDLKTLLPKQGITYHRHFTTPAPLNTWLWFVVAEMDSGYQVGYRSVFDEEDSLLLNFIPKNEHYLKGRENDHDVLKLKQFSQGFYTVEYYADTLVFNDLRFGQITGWSDDTQARFAFHYYLNYPDDNRTVMQRGRFANWNKKTVNDLLERIKGN